MVEYFFDIWNYFFYSCNNIWARLITSFFILPFNKQWEQTVWYLKNNK